MKNIIYIIIIIFISNVYSQEETTILDCKCIEKINKDYGPESLSGNEKWLAFENTEILRDKIFSNLNSDTPVVKSITPPNEYFPDGDIHEFKSTVIHRSGDIIMLKWNNPFGNKIWIATINIINKKAIVTESYNGLTSFGINIETLNCK